MVSVKKHHFEFNSVKYHRDGAQDIDLCSFGRKVDLVGKKARLEVQDKIFDSIIAKRRIETIEAVTIDWKSQKRADVETNEFLKIFKVGARRATDTSYDELSRGQSIKLARFAIDKGPLMRMLNQDAGRARNYLANEGKDGRIVSAIWVLMDGKMANDFEAASAPEVSANVAGIGLDISINVGTKDEYTITVESEVTFAYRMTRVKKWADKDKTRIEELDHDYKNDFAIF